MVNIYKNSKGDFILSEKRLIKNITALETADTLDEAFDLIMDKHYIPSKGVTVRFDRDLADIVYESSIPDINEKSFINVKRYVQ